MSVLSRLRCAYLRSCCWYARARVGDRPADLFYRFLCSFFFRHTHGYWPRFQRPRSLSEKVWHRMLFDRNPLWTLMLDKWAVRDFVRERAGESVLVPVLWHGTRPEELPFDDLPSRFVIKANHGCGYNLLVPDKSRLNREEAVATLKRWLVQDYGSDVYVGVQWGYRHIPPSILVEAFLGESDQPPADFKMYCFDGRVEYVEVHMDRFTGHNTRVFSRAFEPLDFQMGPIEEMRPMSLPSNTEELVRVAEALARGFDFMRVDLYSSGDRVYFGEMTCYHGGGCVRFAKRADDFKVGAHWKLSSP